MTPKQLAFQAAAESIIKNLNQRNVDGYFCEDSTAGGKAILDMMEDGAVI